METLMSKGPGRIEQAIAALFKAEPDNAFTVEDLCERVYVGISWVEKKHRVAVIRAAKHVASRNSNIDVMKGETRGGTLTFYNRSNVMSYAMARKKIDNIGGTYRPGVYNDETYLRSTLAPGGHDHHLVEPGGAWWNHVQQNIAERDGDTEKAAQLKAENDAVLAEIAGRLRGAARLAFGEAPVIRCSFCGKSEKEIDEGVIVAAGDVNICDGCVEESAKVIQEHRAKKGEPLV
jgi:hypothetical protein